MIFDTKRQKVTKMELRPVDYCDVLVCKKLNATSADKQLIDNINNICKERRLKVLIIDSELTVKNKKVVWKMVD